VSCVAVRPKSRDIGVTLISAGPKGAGFGLLAGTIVAFTMAEMVPVLEVKRIED
jgi:hypothetical protein